MTLSIHATGLVNTPCVLEKMCLHASLRYMAITGTMLSTLALEAVSFPPITIPCLLSVPEGGIVKGGEGDDTIVTEYGIGEISTYEYLRITVAKCFRRSKCRRK